MEMAGSAPASLSSIAARIAILSLFLSENLLPQEFVDRLVFTLSAAATLPPLIRAAREQRSKCQQCPNARTFALFLLLQSGAVAIAAGYVPCACKCGTQAEANFRDGTG
jgi:hypothetical protein